MLVIGFPVALIFAWVYEITPDGLKKAADVDQTQSIVYKTGQKLNAAVAVLGVLGVAPFMASACCRSSTDPAGAVRGVPVRPVYDSPEPPACPRDPAYSMDNGLKIIVWPDHDIPNVVMYNFVRAGGRNEYPGITGLSHFFEHMMFNGTENLRARRSSTARWRPRAAPTTPTRSQDVTVYMDWFPGSALETIFELEADRLANLEIYPASSKASAAWFLPSAGSASITTTTDAFTSR